MYMVRFEYVVKRHGEYLLVFLDGRAGWRGRVGDVEADFLTMGELTALVVVVVVVLVLLAVVLVTLVGGGVRGGKLNW